MSRLLTTYRLEGEEKILLKVIQRIKKIAKETGAVIETWEEEKSRLPHWNSNQQYSPPFAILIQLVEEEPK